MSPSTKNLMPADVEVQRCLVVGTEYLLGTYRKTITGIRDDAVRHIYVFDRGRLKFTYTAEEVLALM